VPALKKKRKVRESYQIPRMEKIVVNSWVSARRLKNSAMRTREGLGSDYRAQGAVSKSRHSYRKFQDTEGPNSSGCRGRCGATDVEFLNGCGNGAAADSRLSRSFGTLIRWPRAITSVGINDQTIFPEIELDEIKRPREGIHDRDERAVGTTKAMDL